MSTPEKKIIAVVGATGNQGSSVAKTFLSLPEWHVRALTRDPTSSSAKSLGSLGAEVVAADLDTPSTLTSAFAGAHTIFATTDFFALTKYPNAASLVKDKYGGVPMNQACYKHELSQGKNIIDATAQALANEGKLEVFILSTLSHARKWSGGKIQHLLHFDVKAEIEGYLKGSYSELAGKTRYLMVGFYMGNIYFPFLSPKKEEGGQGEEYVFRWPPVKPETVLPATDPPRDVGVFVRELVKAPAGTVLLGESDPVTVQGLVELWGQVTGKTARLECMEFEEAVSVIEAGMGGGGWGREMVENMLYYRDYGYEGGNPEIKRPGDLGIKADETTSYRTYLKEQDWTGVL